MKDLTHYFQSSPPSCFNSTVSPSNSTNEIETSSFLDSKNKNIDESDVSLSIKKERLKRKNSGESNSSSESPKESEECQSCDVKNDSSILATEQMSKQSIDVHDSDKKSGKIQKKVTGSPSQSSINVRKDKVSLKESENKNRKGVELSKNINSKVNGYIAESNEENCKMIGSSDVEVFTVESNDSVTDVKENVRTDSVKTIQSPNAFQILMSTQQVFSSTNSGKIESSEVVEVKEPVKNENKRKIKESLELMSKRKLEMEKSCRSPETSMDRPSKKRRRIIEESDSDDDNCVKPVKLKTSLASPQNSGKGKNKLKLPELDIIIKEDSVNRECKSKQTLNLSSMKSEKDDSNKSSSGDVGNDVKCNEVKISSENTNEKSIGIEENNKSSPKVNRNIKIGDSSSSKKKNKSKTLTISNKNKKTVKGKSEDVVTHISDREEDSEQLCCSSKQYLKSSNGIDENESSNEIPSNKSAEKVKKKSVRTGNSENMSSRNESICDKNDSISENITSETKSKILPAEDEPVNCKSTINKNDLDVDTKTPSASDAKRKSNIMNYFNKMSNEDERWQPDKIKVKADVHFPSTAPEKASRNSVTKSKVKKKKKKGAKESEDDIVVVNSEIIEKQPEVDFSDASKLSERSSANISLPLGASEKKDLVNREATESRTSKNFVSSDWKMRIRFSEDGVDISPKKRTNKDSTPQSCKRLKLSSNTSSKQEKTSTTSSKVSENKREKNGSDSTTSILKEGESFTIKEITNCDQGETEDKVIEEPMKTEKNVSLPSCEDKGSESSKKSVQEMSTKSSSNLSSLVLEEKISVSSKKESDCKIGKESTPIPKSTASKARNKEHSKKKIFESSEGSKSKASGSVSEEDSITPGKSNNKDSTPTRGKSSSKGKINELSKKSVTETHKESTPKLKGPGDKTKPGMKQSSLTFKSLSFTSKISGDCKKESDKSSVSVIEGEKSSLKCKKSKPQSKTFSAVKRKSLINDKVSEDNQDIESGSKKSTEKESSSENKSGKETVKTGRVKSTPGKKFTSKRATKTDVVDSTPTKKGSPNKRTDSVVKSVSAKKPRVSRKENVEVEEKSEESGDEVEVLDTPVRSRRSCTQPKDTPRRRATPKRKGATPQKQKEAVEEEATNPDSGKRKALRLRLKRIVSVDEESSDSWRSVSPESVVDDEDEPILVRKKKKPVDEEKVSDAEILQMMAERKAILQAIKKAKGKLAKLLNSGAENSVTVLQKGGGVSVVEGASKVANVKLAPVFMKQKLKKPDKATLEAKKSFLLSGVPEEVKKMVEIQKIAEELVEGHSEFPSVSHVQQRDESCGNAWALADMRHKFPCDGESDGVEEPSQIPVGHFTKCNMIENSESKQYSAGRPPQIEVFRDFLRSIKAESPHFPVYRTFRNLYCLLHPLAATGATKTKRKPQRRGRSSASSRKSLEEAEEENKISESSQASWSSKYRPQSSEDILGNGQSVKRLKNWLELWVEAKEGHMNMQSGQSVHAALKLLLITSCEDDFINDGSDDEKKILLPKNPVVILGPNGSGKTMTVYTLARELGFKVLEVNAAAKRTGRRILSELLEATQSHQVQSKEEESSQNIKNFFKSKQKPAAKKEKQKRKLKENEKDKQSNRLSLILVEDVDVVFEDQDEGFISALSTLVAGSKRPIVLISSDPTCPHLSRFTEKSLVLEFSPVAPKLLGVWLQLICLLEGLRVKCSTMEDLLLQNRGDVRKSLMQLQFWVLSGGNIDQPIADNVAEPEDLQDLSDDSSNSSWVLAMDKKKMNEGTFPFHSGCMQVFMPSDPCSVDVNGEKLWWNVPGVLGFNPDFPSQRLRPVPVQGDEPVATVVTNNSKCVDGTTEETPESSVEDSNAVMDSAVKGVEGDGDVGQWKSVCANEDVTAMFSLLDTLSLVESLSRVSEPTLPLCEPTECLWESGPADSLSLNEDMRRSRFAEERLNRTLCSWLVAESVGQCADRLQPNRGDHLTMATELQKNVSDLESRWRRDHHAASLELAEAVPMSYWIERRALSRDYVSSLRNISRLEQGRSCINGKRNNRFFHYLKGLGVDPASGMLETACAAFLSHVNS